MNLKEKTLVGGCAGEENGWNTQLLYFTGSSLSRDDKLLFMISDKGGSPNIVMRDLETGTEKTLTQNSNGTMKSYTSARWFPTGTREFSRGSRSASIRATGSGRTRTRIPFTPMTEDASSSTAEAGAT